MSLWKQQVGEDRRASESADDIFVIRLRVTDDAVSSLSSSLRLASISRFLCAFFCAFPSDRQRDGCGAADKCATVMLAGRGRVAGTA